MILQGASIFALVVAAFVVITALIGVRQVPQGYDYIVERFGRYHKTLSPGLALIVPCPVPSAGSRHGAGHGCPEPGDHHQGRCDGDGGRRRLLSGATTPAARPMESLIFRSALRDIVMTNVRTVIGSMDLDQLLP